MDLSGNSAALRSNRNAVLEALRFVFASAVLCTHLSGDFGIRDETFGTLGPVQITFFKYGNLGVEFFFLLSGALLAASVFRRNRNVMPVNPETLGEETAGYVLKKMRSLWRLYLPASLCAVIYYIMQGEDLMYFIYRLPGLLFLQRTGISEPSFMELTWFLSSMLIAAAVLYPILRRHYGNFTCLIAPLGSLMILGIILFNTSGLGDPYSWMGIIYKCNLRALAEMSLGCTCFEIGRRCREREIPAVTRLLLSVGAVVSILFVLFYMCSNEPPETNGMVVLALAFALVVFFGRLGYWRESPIYRSRFLIYLGSLSLPMYLFQFITRAVFRDVLDFGKVRVNLIAAYLLTIVISVIVKALLGLWERKQKAKREKAVTPVNPE